MKRPIPSNLLLAALAVAACSRVELQSAPDGGGAPEPPRIADVQPAPGPVDPAATFLVAFSTPMDASLLLADAGRSETVAVVASADVELVAAAMARGKLPTHVRKLLLPAQASIDAAARSLTLRPEHALSPGAWWLVVASRLKDAAGRRLSGNGARFGFTVAPQTALPALVSPRNGAVAPVNLARVRATMPASVQGKVLTLQGPDGAVWAGVVSGADGGLSLLQLCSEGADCAVLRPGGAYGLALEGGAVPDAGFTAGECRADAPPALKAGESVVRDDSVAVDVALDAPAAVRLQAALAGVALLGHEDDALDALCAQGACLAAEAFTACLRDACSPADGGAPAAAQDGGAADACAVRVALSGLQPDSSYLYRVVASDDEGHVARGPAARFTTLAALPHVVLSEVMSYPPGPVPRLDAQYVELLNTGGATVDLSALALQGPDETARPLAGAASAPLPLEPGQRALAVGAAFDPARYPALPPAVPVLRAATKRLLGRGLREASPQAFSLVLPRAGAPAVVLDTFAGGSSCPEGHSFERDSSDPAAAPGNATATFHCGASGGSPGLPP